MPTIDDWTETWNWLGISSPASEIDRLAAAYSESNRAYQNRRHLDECCRVFHSMRDHLDHPAAVSLAIWFHSAVYHSRGADNEASSAIWAENGLDQAGWAVIQESLTERFGFDATVSTCGAGMPFERLADDRRSDMTSAR